MRQLVVVNPWRSGENGSEPWTAGLRRALDDAEGACSLFTLSDPPSCAESWSVQVRKPSSSTGTPCPPTLPRCTSTGTRRRSTTARRLTCALIDLTHTKRLEAYLCPRSSAPASTAGLSSTASSVSPVTHLFPTCPHR